MSIEYYGPGGLEGGRTSVVTCLSSDEKPSNPVFCQHMGILLEIDTNKFYRWNDGWVEIPSVAAAHTHPALDISDSTTTGRSLVTATNAAAARTTMGLGNSAILDTGTTSGTVATGDHTHPGGSEAFPVGAVFIAVVSTNPGTLLGYGTWSAFATGRVLVGIDSGDTDFDVVEEVGGVKTSTPSAHSGTAVDNHADHTHGPGTLATDTVTGTRKGGTSGAATLTDSHSHAVNAGITAGASAVLTHSVTQPAAHSAMSVVQPYIVVYMWKRTA